MGLGGRRRRWTPCCTAVVVRGPHKDGNGVKFMTKSFSFIHREVVMMRCAGERK